MKPLWGALIGLSLAVNASAAALPTNYTVQSHGYIWRADGSSATQGSGSISGWPTKTSGTASCTLSQVTASPNGFMPPGSGTLIKVACTAGASPGSISFTARTTGFTMSSVGSFGYYFYSPDGDTSAFTGPNMLLSTSLGNYYAYAGNHNSTMNRRVKGWNLFEFKRGDHYSNVGSMTDALTVLDVVYQFTPTANQSFTIYFGEILKDFYAKPQITIWFADNLKEGYTNGFPYMQARGMTGCYMPTTNYLASPAGTQLTVANLLEMQTAGWDIVPHQTIGTLLTDMTTEAERRAEIEEVFAKHRQYGFTYFDMYYPPGGTHSAAVDELLQSYGVKFGNNSNASALPRPLYGGLINPMHWWAYNADGATFATVKAVIDNAIKYGGYVGILWHAPDAELAAYRQVIDYLYGLRESNVLDVTSCSKFYKRLTNPRKLRATGQ